ncbi:RtcB family protein [Spartinivicinus poritis]|uniref:tRNA-splicing ligase RtcB n=1 Tax=Spartinivicinus poritis TaxID=2994640 RepID=A0ABT5UGG0_9GAMM|nr:RtcB family protein [Spartinivicinus sp. A2-2]MDE1464159.1 RtcB family protein [Spartinivicinus sp. A2-2]
MTTSFKRLVKALNKQNLSVTKANSVYQIAKKGKNSVSSVQILLPEHFDLDGKALKQLMSFAEAYHPNGGAVKAVRATPDFHAGSLVPVGAVLSTTKDFIIPQAIGTDIHCGMRLHVADIDIALWQEKKPLLVEKLRGDLLLGSRDLPMAISSFAALFQNGLLGWIDEIKKHPMGDLQTADFNQLENELESIFEYGSLQGSCKWAPESHTADKRNRIRDASLATIGGGNHFVEFQYLEDIADNKQAFAWGLRKGQLSVMIHTGSRALGLHVGNYWSDKAKRAWPNGKKFPEAGIFPLYGELANDYFSAMNTAANYANLNRLLLAEIVRRRIREVFGANIEMPLVYDAPHNIVTQESDCYVHRKGATPAHAGQPVLIPGSMGHPSYLMMGLGNQAFLCSASHGAGRAKPRHEMFRLNRDGKDIGLGCIDCITLKEDRRIEEAPGAYKDINAVVDVQIQNGIVSPVAKLAPLLTFKG